MIDLVKIPTFTVDEIEKILGDPNSEYNQNPSVRVMLTQRMDELKGGSGATPTVKATKQTPTQGKTVKPTSSVSFLDWRNAITTLTKTKKLSDQEEKAMEDIYSRYQKNVDRNYQLSLLGLTNKEIQTLTQAPIPSIARDIWKKKKETP